MSRLWGGRFSEEPAEGLLAFTESVSFDVELVHMDARVLVAHARSLVLAGLLTDEEATAVSDALGTIAEEIAAGQVSTSPADEDVHTVVERLLLERLPEVGPKVRAGLSRNDRTVAALRLWLLAEGRELLAELADLIEALAARAAEEAATLMPGYTHLQRAQPVTLGHHLLAHATALVRDADRFLDALRRTDASPLGSGALAGSTLGLDPRATAGEAGFTTVMPNSLDAVAARDFAVEFLAAAAICGVHLSRLGEEIVLWTSAEFGFARLAESYTTGSSLMPQKRNPDVAELARGKSGRLIGNLTGLLVTLKGLPLAYNRDLQEDKEPLFDSVATLGLMLPVLTEVIESIAFDGDRLRAAVDDGSLATDLAEVLVGRGMAFREAHELVGRLVARAANEGVPLSTVAAAEIDPEAAAALDPDASVRARHAPGPAPEAVQAQLDRLAEATRRIRGALQTGASSNGA